MDLGTGLQILTMRVRVPPDIPNLRIISATKYTTVNGEVIGSNPIAYAVHAYSSMVERYKVILCNGELLCM
tara:strand:+ start:3663 stop:3875 length:213 start_codon:yes stop_codon:yes gene_type:complete